MICTAKPLRADISVVRTKKSKKNGRSTTNPPQLGIAPTYSVRRRFVASANVNGNFTLASGHNQFLVAITSLIGGSWVDCWRIKKIEIWSPVLAVGGSGGFELTVSGASVDNMFNDRGRVISDNSTSLDRAAHGIWKPVKTQPSGSWHITTSTNSTAVLFTLSATTSSIIDITFAYVPNNYSVPNGFNQAITSSTVGTLLSHVPISNLTPVDVNTA